MPRKRKRNVPTTTAKKELKRLLKSDKTSVLISQFLRVISEIYIMDQLSPGLTLSYLADKGTYYASVCRYERSTEGSVRTVMLNAEHATLLGCLDDLIKKWRDGNRQALKFFHENLVTPKTRKRQIV